MTEIYYKQKEDGFAPFYQKMQGRSPAVVYDANTRPFAEELLKELGDGPVGMTEIFFPDPELVPDESVYETVIRMAEGCDYVLAVGSGSLNDVCKYAGTKLGIPSGVLATAASMDGYLSKGSALMEKGVKVTETVQMPEDVLVDPQIAAAAPKIMTAAGFGDIVGKYTCLADWQLAHILKGEEINTEAFAMMVEARDRLMDSFEELKSYSLPAVEKLLEALLVAGTSMAVCGNSRPASGSEHHQSHFLEMDFVRRGETIPPHGVKVAIGTLVALTMYRDLEKRLREGTLTEETLRNCAGTAAGPEKLREELLSLTGSLPSVEKIRGMLLEMGCPVRFSDVGVHRETMEEMLRKAYTVRDRYTVLTFYHELGIMEEIIDELMEKFF